MEEYFKLLPSDTCAELEFSAESWFIGIYVFE